MSFVLFLLHKILSIKKTVFDFFIFKYCNKYSLSKNKKENFKPGFILTLHTFVRDLKWNSHIHAINTEGASCNITTWDLL